MNLYRHYERQLKCQTYGVDWANISFLMVELILPLQLQQTQLDPCKLTVSIAKEPSTAQVVGYEGAEEISVSLCNIFFSASLARISVLLS